MCCMGGLCTVSARRGDKDLSWKRIVREVEDGKSKWGTKLKEDWKELGVNTERGWCNKVKDRGWLASKLGTSKKKEGRRKEDDSRKHREFIVPSYAGDDFCGSDMDGDVRYVAAARRRERERDASHGGEMTAQIVEEVYASC